MAPHPEIGGRDRLRTRAVRRESVDPGEEEPAIEIRVEQREHVTIIAIVGSVDGATAPALVASFRERVAAGCIRIVGDFSGVDYTSSAGLRALLETAKEARQRGGDLRLSAVQPDVRRVLDLAGFTHILKVFADTDEAVASYPAARS